MAVLLLVVLPLGVASLRRSDDTVLSKEIGHRAAHRACIAVSPGERNLVHTSYGLDDERG